MKFKELIKPQVLKKELSFNLYGVVITLLINVKMPTIVVILTCMSMQISCSVELSMKQVL